MSQLPFPRAILSQHSADLGKTGAGKSSALRVMVEDLLERQKRVVIVDPKGDWWGLKSSADGKGPGFPIVTFGDFKEPYGRGDVPINERSGANVADLIAGGNRPAIIGFRGWMPGHMMQFWIGQGSDPHRADGFLPTLFNKNEGELYVFVDEVQNFAPKGKILSPQAGLCVHWTNKAMSESRGMGMTFHIASQRSQKVHNDTLDCCETLIGMRTVHPAARKAIEDWINSKGDPVLGKEVLSTLAELKRGEAWVWSPENEFGPKRVQFPMFQTFDSFAPPQLQKKVNQSGWSEVDLDQVREKLATVIAEAKANDPKELRAQIVELKRELAKKAASVPVPSVKADENHEKRIAERAAKQATAPLLKRLHEFRRYAAKAQDAMHDVGQRLLDISSAELPPEEAPAPVLASQPRTELARPVQMPPRQVRAQERTNGNGHGESLPIGERKILTALAQFGTVEKDQLTVMTKFKRSTRDAYLLRLTNKGYVANDRGVVAPTQEGLDALGHFDPLPTGRALYEFWQHELPEGEARILRYLVEGQHGKAIPRDELDEPTGFKRSTRDAYLLRMSAKRVVETPGSGLVQAAGALFD
jgi:hypothetical protein